MFHGDNARCEFQKACEDADMKVRQCLIWNKSQSTIGRQDYQWKHEPCLYGWKEGAAHWFVNDRTQTTVIEENDEKLESKTKKELIAMIRSMASSGEPTTVIFWDKPSKSSLHPTMKPIGLMGKFIANSSRRGEIVLDPFGGSGSTLMACEQSGRICRMIELDEGYASAIVERYAKMAGWDNIRLIRDGKETEYGKETAD